MTEKAKRNDPCPCGSGKKYKQCCLIKSRPKTLKQRKATVISSQPTAKQPPNLMEMAFGDALSKAQDEEAPPLAPNPPSFKNTKE